MKTIIALLLAANLGFLAYGIVPFEITKYKAEQVCKDHDGIFNVYQRVGIKGTMCNDGVYFDLEE